MNLAPHGEPRRPLELVSLGRRWQPVGHPEDDEAEPLGLAAADDGLADSPAGWIDSTNADANVPEYSARTETEYRDATPRGATSALQIHNRYLITESEEGVIVIDQPALHERILYEHLRAKVLDGALETQSLLVPEPVDLSPAEAAAALGARDVLAAGHDD